EGNRDRRNPAIAYDSRVGGPNAVPIGIVCLALFSDDCIVLRPKRIDREFISAAPVVVRGKQDGEVIVHAEVGIAPELGRDDLLRVTIEAMHVEVEEAADIKNLPLKLLGFRRTLKKTYLGQF